MNECHRRLWEKCRTGGRFSLEEGILLFECDLLLLGQMADRASARLRKEGRVTFVVDRNIHYTNVCVIQCDYCMFHCLPASKKAFTLDTGSLLAQVRELVEAGGTQVLLQGGVHPGLSLEYFLDLVRTIRQHYPEVHVHGFSAVEFDHMARRFRLSLEELFRRFQEAGLGSIPGAGAEILADRVRRLVSPRKISAARWLEIMRAAHRAGIRSTATMVFGHEETLEERVLHLIKIRELQDETRGFRAFIPWTMVGQGTPSLKRGFPANGDDYLKTVAISRLMLDNIEHIQAGWLTEGSKLGQMALVFGADDMGGILMEDKVLQPAGIRLETGKEDLIRLIREAGFRPAQRNTRYEVIHEFE